MKKLDLLIEYCDECPFLEKVVYFFVCQKTQKRFDSSYVSSFISPDCPLENVSENIDKNKIVKINDRFEILDI